MRVLPIFLCAAALAGVPTQAAFAQRAWGLVVSGAKPLSGRLLDATEQGMREGGFDDPKDCFPLCVGALDFPRSRGSDPTSVLTLTRQVRPRWQVRLSLHGAALGDTEGYDSTSGRILSLRASLNVMTAIVARTSGPESGAWFGAGPALFKILIADHQKPANYSDRSTRVGLVGAAGFRAPFGRNIFLDTEARYQVIGEVHVGPIDYSGPEGTFDQDLRLDHLMLIAGLGVRF